MSWKKNIFSYILWIIYSGATCVGVLGMSVYTVSAADYNVVYGYGFAGVFLLLIGLLVLFGRRLILGKYNSEMVSEERVSDTVVYGKVAESLSLVLLLAAGIWFRVDQLMSISEAAGGMNYIEAAFVKESGTVPLVVHGATYLYLWLLRMLFLVFGNHVAVALILQIVLQLLGAMFLYFAVRKLAGVLSAVISFAFLMLSSYMVDQCAEGSPAFLFFLFYSIVLCCVAGCLKKSCNPVWVVLVGIATGIVSYLDVFGVTILVFFISVMTLKREEDNRLWRRKGTVLIIALISSIAGFILAIGIDALTSGKAFANVIWAWYKLYQPVYSMAWAGQSILADNIWYFLEMFLLLGGMAVGCFSFWCAKKDTHQDVWITLAVVTTLMLAFQMESINGGSEVYLYILFAVLAGIGVETVFVREAVAAEVTEEVQSVEIELFDEPQVVAEKQTTIEGESAEAVSTEPMSAEEVSTEPMKVEAVSTETMNVVAVSVEPVSAATESHEIEPVETENAEEVSEEVTEIVPEQEQPVKIQFLENPLPVPKKHTPKTLDYRLQISDGDQFDFDVTEDDDFDI